VVEKDLDPILCRSRFLERIDEPDKNRKFSLADIEERACWKPLPSSRRALI
jgi:polyphosphate kinase 2 (PPK2 family)